METEYLNEKIKNRSSFIEKNYGEDLKNDFCKNANVLINKHPAEFKHVITIYEMLIDDRHLSEQVN